MATIRRNCVTRLAGRAFSCQLRNMKRGKQYCAPLFLHGLVSARLHAEELDVNGTAEARIEQHVPAGMAVVVIHIDAVAIPFPVAAARNVVGRDHPIGLVVENDVPRARIEAADDNDVPNVPVTAARIVVAGANALAIIIPIVVLATVVMLVPAFVLAVVVVLRAGRGSRREGGYERSKGQQCR